MLRSKAVVMQLSAIMKDINLSQLMVIIFHTVSGIILLACLPILAFPPHVGLIGIISIITAYSILAKRVWAPFLVFFLLVTNTSFVVFTLYSAGFSDTALTFSMLTFVSLTWIMTLMFYFKKKKRY